MKDSSLLQRTAYPSAKWVGMEEIEVQGRFLAGWLDKRLVLQCDLPEQAQIRILTVEALTKHFFHHYFKRDLLA